jgi:hypothetical protein
MKNLPCIVAASGIAVVVLVTVASWLGVSFPYALVVSHIVAFTAAVGVVALFLNDYAPQSLRSETAFRVTEAKHKSKPAAPATVRQHHTAYPTRRSFAEEMTVLGLRKDSATLSLT